jgi:CheY-like chemotaxis protein
MRNGGTTTILLVEDEPLLRVLILDVLVDHGYAVAEAANATEAIEILNGGSDIKLLLTDVRMPGAIDGIELARRVAHSRPEIKILIMSAWIYPRADAVPPGARFIAKPYLPTALLGEVAALLEQENATSGQGAMSGEDRLSG